MPVCWFPEPQNVVFIRPGPSRPHQGRNVVLGTGQKLSPVFPSEPPLSRLPPLRRHRECLTRVESANATSSESLTHIIYGLTLKPYDSMIKKIKK